MIIKQKKSVKSINMYWTTLLLLLMYVHYVLGSNVRSNEKTLKINTDLTQPNVALLDLKSNAAGVGIMFHNTTDISYNNYNNNNNDNQSMDRNVNLTHICTREETYVEQLKIPSMEPVRVRSSNWCLEFPPRCSSYKTEMREIIKVQNITKTRTMRFCCEGYEGNISVNDTICKPVCRGGCGHGYCQTPDICSCEPGYMGKHCTQRCDHDHWGLQCQNVCQCLNGAACDNKSGLCHCTAGWTGEFCEQACPTGTYGIMCRQKCACGTLQQCHALTGACGNNAVDNNITHVMIATLNSTIVNITNNLDRIAKNIMTTPTTAPDVILIKQDDAQPAPKIIVHNADANAASNGPEVIHVITGWPSNKSNTTAHQLNLAGISTATHADVGSHDINAVAQHDANLLSTLLIILLIIVIAIAATFLYIYRCNHLQKAHLNTAANSNNVPGIMGEDVTDTVNKSLFHALPGLSNFTKVAHNKIDGPESCDSSRRTSNIDSIPYTYARKESIYSVVTPKSRKSSPDSHLYDEIRYPTFHLQFNDQLHMQPTQRMPQANMESPQCLEAMVQHQNNFNESMTYHTTRVIIPKVNSKFLHVPQISQKVAHI